jgi:hypothetical protein
MAFNKHKNPKLVYGVGINDASYVVARRENGKQVMCPVYCMWKSMLHRCYGAKTLDYNKAYIGCSVDPEWIRFSGFEKWLLQQPDNWRTEDYELDKDLLVEGNRVYGPNTCLLVPKVVNNFFYQKFTEDIGVRYFPNRKKPWRAACGSGKRNDKWIAYFATKQEARDAYLKEKIERGNSIAQTLQDPIVKNAFIARLKLFESRMTSLV